MRDGEATRQRLLDVATQLVHERGFLATSLSDLLNAAGIKKGSLYYHFPGKDDLGLAVLQRAKGQFLQALNERLAAPTPAQSLERFFDFVLEWHRGKGFVGGCLFGNTALETSDTHRRYANAVREVFREWIDRLAAVIRAGQSAGQFRADIPAPTLAEVTVATIEGGIMLARLHKAEGPLRACLESLRTFLRPLADGGRANLSQAQAADPAPIAPTSTAPQIPCKHSSPHSDIPQDGSSQASLEGTY